MRLPALLSRRQRNVHKNDFGHVLIIAGSNRYLGAGALCALASARSGAGLVTLAVPQSLNTPAQKKVANVVMTLPLKETLQQTIALTAYPQIAEFYPKIKAIAVGPGMTTNPMTKKFILKLIQSSPVPLIIDADALNALSGHLNSLTKTPTLKILTPHPGEMARLLNIDKKRIEADRKKYAQEFAQKYQCFLILKGHQTVVASPQGKIYVNKTGNPGMATGGTGDVLTGIIAAFIAQGVDGFAAAKFGVYLHGYAGDLAARNKTRVAMIASDIIESLPQSLAKLSKH
ncbi:MAG: NAD(P)H-hydrate dehydratase [Candidatus Omnitrophica bacterium]|nr:NAD(P)H-hydrate dehydratase [Candidatus Omnitrophota bacterium]